MEPIIFKKIIKDEEKPENAHNAVTNIGDDLKIVRATIPFANTSKREHKTYIIDYQYNIFLIILN